MNSLPAGHHYSNAPSIQRDTWRLIQISCLVLAFAGVRTTAFASSEAASSPGVQTLLNAPTPIEKTNATNLRLVWSTNIPDHASSTNIPDHRQHKVSTIIRNGTMYLAAPHHGGLALNASDRRVRRLAPHDPTYVLLHRDTSSTVDSMVAFYTNSPVVVDISAPTFTDHAKMSKPATASSAPTQPVEAHPKPPAMARPPSQAPSALAMLKAE
jgi:hypothetical protein